MLRRQGHWTNENRTFFSGWKSYCTMKECLKWKECLCGEASPVTCPGPLSWTDVSSQEYQAFTKHRDRLKLCEGVRNASPTPGPKRCEFSVSRTLRNGPGACNSFSCRPQSREWVDVAQLWGWRVWHPRYCSRRIPFSCFLSFLPQGHAPHLVNFPFCLRGLQCI